MKIKSYTQKFTKTNCPTCGTRIRFTTKLIIPMVGSLVTGYIIADAPEIFQTKNDVIQMYESMNACMKYSYSYREHRDLCACALMETYGKFKFSNTKVRFEENLKNCSQ
ncbi:hypothetical protein PHA51_05540 [Rodentibacter pneumotropicus]|uniref:Uncharacterized protein n=1 Tax=Rodentibacter pneumotropicus TaxID=758 RepID=A0A4S2Q2L0_9PAST|nr:hypothetical protein [Rodentibacter pneumotropicus]MDC2825499.1 hypothetical protein [Rodentibacter pneumotropicus]THA10750.1 hypothetical protein D3M78_02165 [Rodentibacter pneumotropicus]